jgi:hypothetical protein
MKKRYEVMVGVNKDGQKYKITCPVQNCKYPMESCQHCVLSKEELLA